MKRLLTLVASVALGVASAFADAPTWTFTKTGTFSTTGETGTLVSSDGWKFTGVSYTSGSYKGNYRLDVCEEGEGTLDLTNLPVREILSACFTNHRTVTRLVGAEKLALITTAFQNDTTLGGEVRLPAMTSVPANAFNTQGVGLSTPRKITDFYLPKATALNNSAFRSQVAIKTILAPNAKPGTSTYSLAQLTSLEYAELGSGVSFSASTFYNTMTTARKAYWSLGGVAPKFASTGWANNCSATVANRQAPLIFVARDYAANTASWDALVVATEENPGDYSDMFTADYKFADYRPPAEHLLGLAVYGTGYAWIVKTPVHLVLVRDTNGEIANRYCVYHGESVELETPQAPEGMKLVNWVGTRTVESNLDIQPEFEEDSAEVTTYVLTIPTVEHATAEVKVNGKVTAPEVYTAGVREGATVVVMWTAEAGYKITAGGEETIQMTEAKAATAPTVEAIPVYALTIPSVEHASAVVTVDGSTTETREFLEGTTVVVTWTPASGYKITNGVTETIEMTEAKTAAKPTVETFAPNVTIPSGTVKYAIPNTYSGADRYEVVAEDGTVVSRTKTSAYLPILENGKKITNYSVNCLDASDKVLKTFPAAVIVLKEATETPETVMIPCVTAPMNASNIGAHTTSTLLVPDYFSKGDVLKTYYNSSTYLSAGTTYQSWTYTGTAWGRDTVVKADGTTYTTASITTSSSAARGSVYWLTTKGRVVTAGLISTTATPPYASTSAGAGYRLLCNPRLNEMALSANSSFTKVAGEDDEIVMCDEPNTRYVRIGSGKWEKYVNKELVETGIPVLKPFQCFWLYRGSGKAPVRN